MSSKNSSLAVFCVTGLVVGIGLVVAPWFIEALPQPSKLVLAVSGAVLTGLFGILVVITRLYIKASADEAFVRTGVGGRECVIDGGALVIPVVHNIMRVSLRTFKLVVQRTGTDALITHDCLRAEVKAVFYVRVQKEKEAIEQAATSLGQISDDLAKMEDLIQDKLISALRTVAATKTLNDLNSKLAEFAEAVQKIVQADLRTNGLTLESVTINKLDQAPQSAMRPDDNVFDAQGARTIAEQVQRQRVDRNTITREADQRVKAQDVETAMYVANQDLEQARALAEAEAKKQMAQAEAAAKAAAFAAEQDRIAGTARVEANRQVELSTVNKAKAIQVAEQERDQATQVAEVTRTQAVEVANRQKQVAVAEAEKKRAEAQAAQLEAEKERETAAQAVKTTEATMQAERQKAQAVIAKQAEAEQRRIAQEVEANVAAYTAAKLAEGEKLAAEQQAQARVALAEAERQAQALEAEGQKAVQMVPVTVQAEQVKVNSEQVSVDIRKLEGQSQFETIAKELQVQLAVIEAEKQAKIAAAQAFGQALAAARINIWGDPSAVEKMSQSFFGGQSLAALANGLLGALPQGVTDLLKQRTGVDLSGIQGPVPSAPKGEDGVLGNARTSDSS